MRGTTWVTKRGLAAQEGLSIVEMAWLPFSFTANADPICEEAIWRSRYNEELYRLHDEADLVTTIKITRLRWAGHVMLMQDNLLCKKITLDKPKGRRRAGRPNLRWIDGVTKEAENLGVRNWRARVRDRDEWRRLLESAKTLHGLYRLGVSEWANADMLPND